jgi:hypothetical protein
MICHATVRFSSSLEATIDLPDDVNRVELGNIKRLVIDRLCARHPELGEVPSDTIRLISLTFEGK